MANNELHQIKLFNISNESLFFELYYGASCFSNNEKCSSYDVLNGHRYSKNNKELEYSIGYSRQPYKQ